MTWAMALKLLSCLYFVLFFVCFLDTLTQSYAKGCIKQTGMEGPEPGTKNKKRALLADVR